jgi:hypothetical protein
LEFFGTGPDYGRDFTDDPTLCNTWSIDVFNDINEYLDHHHQPFIQRNLDHYLFNDDSSSYIGDMGLA